jgi:aspartyl protease family protein
MNERTGNVIYYAMAILLVLSSLISMKLPLGKALKIVLAWVAIFAVFFLIFAFRDDFAALGQRLKAETAGSAIADGQEVRIPVGDDGHFWVEAKVNSQAGRFLIDSGASVTTISSGFAARAGVAANGRRIVVETANGPAPTTQAYANKLDVQSIGRADFPINISDHDQTNVLGMNFLSTLKSWRVEGNYPVLKP